METAPSAYRKLFWVKIQCPDTSLSENSTQLLKWTFPSPWAHRPLSNRKHCCISADQHLEAASPSIPAYSSPPWGKSHGSLTRPCRPLTTVRSRPGRKTSTGITVLPFLLDPRWFCIDWQSSSLCPVPRSGDNKNNNFFFPNIFLCMGILPECLYVYHVHVWCPQRLEEGTSDLDLELQMVVSWYLGLSTPSSAHTSLEPVEVRGHRGELFISYTPGGSWAQTQVVRPASELPYLLSHLSVRGMVFFTIRIPFPLDI